MSIAAVTLKNPVTAMVPFGGFGNSSAGSVVEWNVPHHRRVRRRDLVATAG
jgi:hypothetical protein